MSDETSGGRFMCSQESGGLFLAGAGTVADPTYNVIIVPQCMGDRR